MKYFFLKDSLITYEHLNLGYKLPICLGIDEKGKEHFADLVDLEHILMAGSTGSGKSVFNNDIICGLMTRFSPDYVRFYLTDVKRVELSLYNKAAQYLISPVDVEVDRSHEGLERVAREKNRRLETILRSGSKSIQEYNLKFPNQKFPYLVTIVDTFSDLVMYDPERFEKIIQNLTSDATKAGIHLVMCDSRPSPDVYPEAIKNCFPTKIAFNTSSSIDSKVIIGQEGAEQLLGRGDLFLQRKGQTKLLHLQAPYVSDQEVHNYISEETSKTGNNSGFVEGNKNSLFCKAFVIDLFGKRYMLHFWFKPHFSVAWHRKRDGLVGKLFWIQRFK